MNPNQYRLKWPNMFLVEIRVKNVLSLCIYKARILITCALFRFSKYGFINIIFEVLVIE